MVNNITALIAGPTDKTKIFRFGSISRNQYPIFLQEIGQVLAHNIDKINLIPDDGVPLDIAKAYKSSGGNLVEGYIPKGGCSFIEQYFKFCDNIIEFNTGWSGLNTCLSLKGNVLLVFGLSSGTIVEIGYIKYHQKYIGKKIPILMDKRAFSGIIPPELIDELDISIFSSNDELVELLNNIQIKMKGA